MALISNPQKLCAAATQRGLRRKSSEYLRIPISQLTLGFIVTLEHSDGVTKFHFD